MVDRVRFQHYEVLCRDDGSLFELGRGAMGITYKAFDTNLRTNVALKVINATYLGSDVARQRFLREARAAAAIRHPNVATVFHLGNENDSYFYAMEFIDGETVENFMQREGAIPTLMALEICLQVARALAAAEKQGLVHRDIKPSNLMLEHEADEDKFTVKVIDFGLAKAAEKDAAETAITLTQSGFLGTPHFASPEQLEEQELDSRSDIYSLGVALYYMLAGRMPFSGSLAQVMSQHLHREPPLELLSEQPRQVIRLLERMMAKNPNARPQSPAELRREIEACMTAVIASRTGTKGGAPSEATDAETIADALREPSAIKPAPGLKLAERFELIEQSQSEKFGNTFRARNLENGEMVAVLILNASLLPTSEAYTRLENEVTLVQSVKHPAIIRVQGLERAEHFSFVICEWIEGLSLLDAMRKHGALPIGDTIEILTSLAGGLEALQKIGIPCPMLSAHGITLVQDTQTGTTLPKFNALNFSTVAPSNPDETLVSLSASRPTPGTNGYVLTLATLAYRMLGGMGAVENLTDTFIPIPGISEEANLVLRRALKSDASYTSPAAFVAALEDAIGDATSAPLRLPFLPTAVEPQPHKRVSTALLITSGLGLTALILVGAILLTEKRLPPTVSEVTPTPKPLSIATPVLTPTPDPRKVALDLAIQGVEDKAILEDYVGAFSLIDDLANKYPEASDRLKKETEKIAAKLASETNYHLNAEQLSSLGDLLKNASQRGSTSAQMILGQSYRIENPSEAFNHFYLAATDGKNSESMFQLGELFASGRGTGGKDLVKAVEWYQKSAEGLYPPAIYALGECYYFGKGCDKNPTRAFEFLNLAANQYNNAYAQILLGDIYYEGKLFGKKNYVETARLWGKAAAQGLDDARTKLIVMVFNGEILNGKPVTSEPNPEIADKKAAFEQFKAESLKGNRSSMYFYARCLLGGLPDMLDEAAGRKQMVIAAERGDPQAQAFCQQRGWKFNIPVR